MSRMDSLHAPLPPAVRAGRMAWSIVVAGLFLALFIVPFLLFGDGMEQFARTLLTGPASDGLAMVAAGALLAGDAVLPTPSSVVATLLATKVGFWPAALVNAAALSVAAAAGYGLGRVGGTGLERVRRGLPPGFAAWVRRHGLVAVLLCRPVPVLSEASLVLAGAARADPRPLLVWCTVLQTALGFAYAFAGSGWGQGRVDATAIVSGAVLLPLVAATVAGLATLLSRQPPGRKSGAAAQPAPPAGAD